MCRPHSPIHWPVTVLTLLFTVANPLCPATGNAMLDELVIHMPAFMFITLPLIVAAWGAVQIFKGHGEPTQLLNRRPRAGTRWHKPRTGRAK